MDNEEYGVWYYAKLFILIVIPVYGLFFSLLLVFSKDISNNLKNLIKGTLIARVVFWILGTGLFVVGWNTVSSLLNMNFQKSDLFGMLLKWQNL